MAVLINIVILLIKTAYDKIVLFLIYKRRFNMENIDIANGLIFQKMRISKDSFDDRLICQKKVYLLQSLGTDLGYSYNWYVRGPYSPSLTNYVYNNLDVLTSENFSDYKLSVIAKKNVDKVNDLVRDKITELSVVSWYELLASLLYIDNNRESWKIDKTDKALFKELIKYKPQYSEQQGAEAYDILKQRGFVKLGV